MAHFIVGKGISAIIGIAWMLFLVRALSAQDYGLYVTLLAFSEIYILASSFGINTVPERYIPELRASNHYAKLAKLALFSTLIRFFILSLMALVLISFSSYLLSFIGVPEVQKVLPVFFIIACIEGVSRFVESTFDSLLKQKLSQISLLCRTGIRLTALCYMMNTTAQLSLQDWVMAEALACSLSFFITLSLLVSTLRGYSLLGEKEADTKLELSRMTKYAIPVYFSQLVWLTSSIDVAKLIIVRILGAESVALFGFCAALASTLQRYLPTYLLIGLIRPLFATSGNSANRSATINELYTLIIKLNGFVVIPCALTLLIVGDPLLQVLSSQKFNQGSLLLSLMIGYVLSQSFRMTHSLVLMSMEDGKGSLMSVVMSALSFFLVTSILLSLNTGHYGPVIGLITADALAMFIMLKRANTHKIKLIFPIKPLAKITLASLISATVAEAILRNVNESNLTILAISGVVAGITFLLAAAALKPFTRQENQRINSMLPLKIFIW